MEQQYEMLSAAIIEQALRDYRRARINILKKYDVINSGIRIREIQKFFKSRWFRFLSELDGEKLIELMENEEIKLNEPDTKECEMQKVSCVV
jgi:hypothetical protein